MKRRLLPLWFHWVTAGGLASLFLGFLVVRSGGVDARAQAVFERLAGTAQPVLNAQAMLGRRTAETPQGSYRMNGMHVKYFTVGAPQGGGSSIIELERMMARAGYVHRILPIQGVPVLFGIHPETKVMLSARPGRDLQGYPAVRLSQQNLGELREDFPAEIPDVPTYPGASGKMLIASDEGPWSESLMYAAGGSIDDIRGYYLKEMKLAGWTAFSAPPAPRGLGAGVLFFKNRDRECSLLLAEIPATASSLVLVTVSGRRGEEEG